MSNNMDNNMDKDFHGYRTWRSCLNVFHLPYEKRCEYVRTSADCSRQRKIFDYIKIMSCDMNINSFSDELSAMSIWILAMMLFTLIIAIVADKYFAPSLKVVARLLHMNEHLAGVTILAFGNSSADLFGNLVSSGRESPLFSNALAGALFVTMVGGGVTCYMSPFKLNGNGIVRDLLFFIAGALLLDFCILNDNNITLAESIYLMCFYVLYIVVILLDQFLLKMLIRERLALLDNMQGRAHRELNQEKMLEYELKDFVAEAGIEMKDRKKTKNDGKLETLNEDSTRKALYVPGTPRNRNLFIGFLEDIMPIDPIDWHTSGCCPKVFMLIKAPVHFIFALLIPHVDLEENKHAWSKLLNCLNVITMPSITAVIITSFFVKSDFIWRMAVNPMYLIYPLPVTVPLSLIIFLSSRTDLPPPYHFIFALMSIIASMFVIFVCASEISQIMTLLCTVWNFSEDFMGATIGAIASSIGDIVINTAMSMHGYGEMAFAAAVGGPFFELVFVTGITFLTHVIEYPGNTLPVYVGLFGETCFIFILMAMGTTLFWTLVLNFQVRRSVGVYSVVVYIIFLGMAVLVEMEVIHSWAPDDVIQFPNV